MERHMPQHIDLQGALRAGVEGLRTHLELVSQDQRIAKAHARYVRILFEALREEGFTEGQALQVVSGAPLPGAR